MYEKMEVRVESLEADNEDFILNIRKGIYICVKLILN
jgi:hypothetical protein